MTQTNNFSQKNKLFRAWEQTASNQIALDFQVDKQTVVIKELHKSLVSDQKNNQIVDLTTSFITPNVGSIDESGFNYGVLEIFQNWDVTITGLLLEELIGYRVNLLVQIAADGEILPMSDTTGQRYFLQNNFFSADSKVNDRSTTYTLHYGFYLSDTLGIKEFNDKDMKVALGVMFVNPLYLN